ncbi:OB-fold domain-containing protein [Amycolatopsis rhizosphaerae]|uniref:OB-fold domain-containing protein n=1 Tax=Amycolatopsis rhizosphaerae TaxID=2053003 RepID=A0A558DCX2_9PSEU|nr:OB-fold domain-containing protein [Amycolatopsis rhizosphaerae]TVT58885.1 OB-fold domain-containing protein [Amycolatopsis rhizosphaerae]
MTDAVDVCSRCGTATVTGTAATDVPVPPCRACGATPDRIAAGAAGRVYTWSTVHRGMPGVPVPYTVAYADFDGGTRLFARVSGAVCIGTTVTVVPEDEAGFRFVVQEEAVA